MKRLLAVALSFVAFSVSAATKTWSGAGAGSSGVGQWSVGANWVGGVAPVAGDDLVFPQQVLFSSSNNDFPAGMTFGAISVAGFYTFRGNPFEATTLQIGPSSFTRLVLPQGTAISAPTTIVDGATLSMDGSSIAGPVTVSNGGVELLDGASVGNLTLSNGARLSMSAFTDYQASVSARTTGLSMDSSTRWVVALRPTGSTRLTVTGPVALGDATLFHLIPDPFYSFFGQPITLIDNTGDQPVSGKFAGLPEGAIVEQDLVRQKFTISYVGGTGNDIVLTPLPIGSSTIVLTTSPNPSIDGKPITLTATVTTSNGSPAAGLVRFQGPTNQFDVPWTCDAQLDPTGVATCTTTQVAYLGPSVGTFSISAAWTGNATTVGSRSIVMQTILADVPTLDGRALTLLGLALAAIAVAKLGVVR